MLKYKTIVVDANNTDDESVNSAFAQYPHDEVIKVNTENIKEVFDLIFKITEKFWGVLFVTENETLCKTLLALNAMIINKFAVLCNGEMHDKDAQTAYQERIVTSKTGEKFLPCKELAQNIVITDDGKILVKSTLCIEEEAEPLFAHDDSLWGYATELSIHNYKGEVAKFISDDYKKASFVQRIDFAKKYLTLAKKGYFSPESILLFETKDTYTLLPSDEPTPLPSSEDFGKIMYQIFCHEEIGNDKLLFSLISAKLSDSSTPNSVFEFLEIALLHQADIELIFYLADNLLDKLNIINTIKEGEIFNENEI